MLQVASVNQLTPCVTTGAEALDQAGFNRAHAAFWTVRRARPVPSISSLGVRRHAEAGQHPRGAFRDQL